MLNSLSQVRWKKHLVLFTTALVGVVVGVLFQIVGEGKPHSEALAALRSYVFFLYLPLAAGALAIELALRSRTHPALYLYYAIWVRRLFPRLQNLVRGKPGTLGRLARLVLNRVDEAQTDLVRLSMATNESGKPLIVRREHLMAKHFLPHWAFSIVLLYNAPVIRRIGQGATRFRLDVDLRHQSLGLYNSSGKQFLRSLYLDGISGHAYLQQGSEVDAFLRGELKGPEIRLRPPLRWASGGGLGIARWQGRTWVTVFFRGVPPVGWNLANGASEKKDEYKNLHHLMMREFCEELVVLDREPQPEDRLPLVHKLFAPADPLFSELPQDVRDDLRSRSFTNKHTALRIEHDGWSLESKQRITLESVQTPFDVEVRYHTPSGREGPEPFRVKDVVFSVNPGEMGIETIGIYRFELEPNDYLVFGEIWELAECLLREPVMLISTEYLKKIYRSQRCSLGTEVLEEPFIGGKRLDRIPASEFHIFDADIEFRHRRIATLETRSALSRDEQAELALSRDWLQRYAEMFENLRGSSRDITASEFSAAATLCPVTWRTIETLCRESLLGAP